jgi:CheY-like chemotaxis protein
MNTEDIDDCINPADKIEFLENLNHVIRSRITGILGFARVIENQVDDPKMKADLNHLIHSSVALLNLLDTLFKTAQNLSNGMPIKAAFGDEKFERELLSQTLITLVPPTTLLGDNPQQPIKTEPYNTKNEINYILLVEDQPIAAEITKSMLSELNCEVDIATSAKTAIFQAQNKSYDLIFMDLGLPDLNGYETTKRIRLQELIKGRHVPIIALTVHADNQDRSYCFGAGMNAILTKPLFKEKAQDVLNAFIPKIKELKIPVAANDEMNWAVLAGNVIDLEHGARLFNGNVKLAKQMITSMITNLDTDEHELEEAHHSGNWLRIMEIVRKIRGIICYCGTPRLEEACTRLENHLKAGYRGLAHTLYQQLLREIEAVKKKYPKLI